MNDSTGSFDCITIRKATIPMTIQPKLCRPAPLITRFASRTQTTPERFAAIAFCNPWVLPPAA